MLIAIIGLSVVAGDFAWKMSIFAGLLGGGFGLVNTPLSTAVSRTVESRLLGSALGVNSMLFFIGGSVGAAALLGLSSTGSSSSLNPFHDGVAAGFSNGFLFLAIPLVAALLLTFKLPGRAHKAVTVTEPPSIREWRGDCSVPWHPDVDHLAR